MGAASAAKASAERARVDRRAAARRVAAALLDATANPDGPGILLRGSEHQPRGADAFDQAVVTALVRLSLLAQRAGVELLDHPDAGVRRSAAILAARAHPLLAGLGTHG